MPTTTSSTTTFSPTALPISEDFQQCLLKVLKLYPDELGNHITINFRDKGYSAENGGFHPVEIALVKQADSQYSILYITDLSYCGNAYPELERDIDFDIGNLMAFPRHTGWQNIRLPSVTELYELWEGNFISYVGIDAYDEIQVESY